MKLKGSLFVLAAVLLTAGLSFAQTPGRKTVAPVSSSKAESVRTSPAYAEVLLRRTELSAELEALLIEYTEEYPKVKELRYESSLLQKELDRLLAVNLPDASRLSAALGKLMVRKCELGTDLWALQLQFNDQHPDVRRAKRKADMFETAIAEILQGK